MVTFGQSAIVLFIVFYQRWVSPRKGYRCAHRIAHDGLSCSEWGKRAAKRAGTSPTARPARVAAFSITPSVIVAAVLTIKFLSRTEPLPDEVQYIVPVWMLLYGTGVYTAGTHGYATRGSRPPESVPATRGGENGKIESSSADPSRRAPPPRPQVQPAQRRQREDHGHREQPMP